MASTPPPSNYKHLRAHDAQLLRLGQLAERYFPEDPNTCLLKLRQLFELVASNVGLFTSPDEKQADLLRRLQDQGIVPREVGNLFHEVRRTGNDANHRLAGDRSADQGQCAGGPLRHRRPRLALQARGRRLQPAGQGLHGQLQPVLDAFNDALWTLPTA